MEKNDYTYLILQCLLVLFCGVVGLVGVCIETTLPREVAILFAIVFLLCFMVALFFLILIRYKRKQEAEDRLIDAIGEAE
ncbi:hypothetical protein FC093_09980 [Ilyomonas limi]|uniref:Uncharacterized protein n=1 Tax=Ilyomonas limi TaxID=2575867 RepID=A0A4U3L1J8_9BACT|nr:hypothetical protein [Ilyomonas limi]TKK69011.1 hypothetical protein FC093_09980 [Ilyomonas limi]